MIDLGQCEPSLRARSKSETPTVSWTFALNTAARQLGYLHHFDTPEDKVETLKKLAHEIRGTRD